MTEISTASAERTRRALCNAARSLIDGTRPALDVDGVDVDLALLRSARTVHIELGLLQEEFARGGEHPQIIAGIVDLAVSYGVSCSGAIGVCGSLVGMVNDRDDAATGQLLALAHDRMEDGELFAGAAALLAAATCYLADAVSVPPLDVHDEVHRTLSLPAGARRRTFCRERSVDPTW